MRLSTFLLPLAACIGPRGYQRRLSGKRGHDPLEHHFFNIQYHSGHIAH
jgi:hypothetical protein